MDDAEVLAHLRLVVLVLDPIGTIVQASGGAQPLLGYDVADLVGRHAMEFVAPRDLDQVALIFFGGEGSVRRRFQPPFALRLINASGGIESVECLATGVSGDDGFCWVLTLTPRALQPVSYHALDRYLAGGDATEVAITVIERLPTDSTEGIRVDNAELPDAEQGVWVKGFVLGHRVGGVLTEVAGGDDGTALASALRSSVDDPAAPWNRPDPPRRGPFALAELPGPVAAAASGAGLCVADARIVCAEGDPHLAMLLFGNQMTTFNGNIGMILDDATEIVTKALTHGLAAEVLRHAAECDALTGLANRARFAQVLDDEPMGEHAVLYLDLDSFKAINDTFGHAVGDAVLTEVAGRITAVCRPGDEVARLGGDEFAVLLRGVDDDGAVRIGQRLVRHLAEPLPSELGPDQVKVTVGLATGTEEVSGLVESADLAMLSGKRSRRGNLTTARRPQPNALDLLA